VHHAPIIISSLAQEAGLRSKFRERYMPYLSGVLTGILLTILVVFLIDHLGPQPDTRDIVNWDYVGATLGASVEKVGEEVRQEVHEATEPNDKDASAPPAATDTQ
jgi:hypothetical protein